MEPTSEWMRQNESKMPLPSDKKVSSRDILAQSLKVFSNFLKTPVAPNDSFWIRYDIQTGSVLSVHDLKSFTVTSSSPARGRHIRHLPTFRDEGVPIRYRVKQGIQPLNFYVPLEENDYMQNVEAFELTINTLAFYCHHPKTLEDLITPEVIDKLLRAKPKKAFDRFYIPDPLLILINRSK